MNQVKLFKKCFLTNKTLQNFHALSAKASTENFHDTPLHMLSQLGPLPAYCKLRHSARHLIFKNTELMSKTVLYQ